MRTVQPSPRQVLVFTLAVSAVIMACTQAAGGMPPTSSPPSTDATGTPLVRERYWVTFQPGEVRVCTSCHGLNEQDQAGHPIPINPPKALLTLLEHWKGLPK
jgi:hypothetical protein